MTGLNKSSPNMELKEKLLSSFMVMEQDVDLSAPVHDLRTQSLKTFEKLGIPTAWDKLV